MFGLVIILYDSVNDYTSCMHHWTIKKCQSRSQSFMRRNTDCEYNDNVSIPNTTVTVSIKTLNLLVKKIFCRINHRSNAPSRLTVFYAAKFDCFHFNMLLQVIADTTRRFPQIVSNKTENIKNNY